MCRHLHHILIFRYYAREIPPHFIMERWTKRANRSQVLGFDGVIMKDDKSGMEAMRISHYCQRSTELAYIMGKSEKAYDVAMDLLNQAFEKVMEIDMLELGQELGNNMEELGANVEPIVTHKSYTMNESVANDESCASSPAKKMGNPRISQTKGRKSDKEKASAEGNSRFKSGIELNKKVRTCRTCKEVNANHDSRNCPMKKQTQLLCDSSNIGS
ncbi:hypothetical protein MKW92_012425 [Papaver armeniacum]|nr:hypothetical protein MKW92_012425 [Papaver armeniacum]